MKINPGIRPFGKDVKISEQAAPQPVLPKNFSEMMQQQDEQVTLDQLKQKLEQIHRQGERLSKSMTVRELRSYKLLIKQFLEETARKGIVLRATKGWDRRGRGKRYKLLEEADRKLLEMADELLESEQGKIQILNDIGEIRGLLINLFF